MARARAALIRACGPPSSSEFDDLTGAATITGVWFFDFDHGQTGVGERMITVVDGRPTCIGYATFVEHHSEMREWLDPLERDLKEVGQNGRRRLVDLQHLLLELVRRLDEGQRRYPFNLEKA